MTGADFIVRCSIVLAAVTGCRDEGGVEDVESLRDGITIEAVGSPVLDEGGVGLSRSQEEDMTCEEVRCAAAVLQGFADDLEQVIQEGCRDGLGQLVDRVKDAVRAIGTTGNPAWASLLERVWLETLEVRTLDPMGYLDVRSPFGLAWRDVMWTEVEAKGGIRWVRDQWAESPSPGTLRLTGVGMVFDKLVAEMGWSSPEVLTLFDDDNVNVRRRLMFKLPVAGHLDDEVRLKWLELHLDPDERVRPIARISKSSTGGDLWVEPLRRFLERNDLTEEARETAMRALHVRGWTVSEAENGLEAVRLNGGD